MWGVGWDCRGTRRVDLAFIWVWRLMVIIARVMRGARNSGLRRGLIRESVAGRIRSTTVGGLGPGRMRMRGVMAVRHCVLGWAVLRPPFDFINIRKIRLNLSSRGCRVAARMVKLALVRLTGYLGGEPLQGWVEQRKKHSAFKVLRDSLNRKR